MSFTEIMLAVVALEGLVALLVLPRPRRWLLWNVRCRRGRKCADLKISGHNCPVPGVVVHLEYWCGSCGTHYERSALLGFDGILTQSDRAVVK